jgi:hypothetical protein
MYTRGIIKSALHGVYDNPSFEAPLLNSLILKRGVGTPTFTRSDTANYSATVTDFEGVIRLVLNGEARFESARRVENIFKNTENIASGIDWSNCASGTATRTNVASPLPIGGTVARITATSSNFAGVRQVVSGLANSSRHVCRVWLASGTATTLKIMMENGTSSYGVYFLTTLYNVPAEGAYYSVDFGVSRATGVIVANFEVYTSDGIGKTFFIGYPQLEKVQGQTNKAPSEYVSTGVLSAPYHGTNKDGVKYFTTTNGNTVVNNVVVEAAGTTIADATLKGYLAEGSRVNLLKYSEQVDMVLSWGIIGNPLSRTANQATAPDGTLTADKLERLSAGNARIGQQIAITALASPTYYTFSVFIKKDNDETRFSEASLVIDGSGSSSLYVDINTKTGATAVRFSAGTASHVVADFGLWWRLCITVLGGTSCTTISSTLVPVIGDVLGLYNGNTLGSAYFWGAQLEAGSFASSYIPTLASAVTRGSDALTYQTSGNINVMQGSSFARWIPAQTVTAMTTTHIIDWRSNYALLMAKQNVGGIGLSDGVNTAFGGLISQNMKGAGTWGGGSMKAFSNGVAGTATTFAGNVQSAAGYTYPNYFGIGGETAHFFGTIKRVEIWKIIKSDTFSKAITT